MSDPGDVLAALGGERIGQPIDARVARGGRAERLTVTVGERPRAPALSAARRVRLGVETALGEVAERLGRVTVHVRAGGAERGRRRRLAPRAALVVTNAHVATGHRRRGRAARRAGAPARVARARPAAGSRGARPDRRRRSAALRVDARGLRARRAGGRGRPPARRGLRGGARASCIARRAAARGPAGWLQADIRLAPGNSGGPLADAPGRVVGINAMIVGGLGFAVPTHVVERFVHEIERAARRSARGVIRVLVVARSELERAGLEALLAGRGHVPVGGGSATLAEARRRHRGGRRRRAGGARAGRARRRAAAARAHAGRGRRRRRRSSLLGESLPRGWAVRAVRAGARAVLPRTASADAIVAAVEAAAAGLVVLPADALAEVPQGTRRAIARRRPSR